MTESKPDGSQWFGRRWMTVAGILVLLLLSLPAIRMVVEEPAPAANSPADAPYPPSGMLSVTFDPASAQQAAHGSDNWPVTWAWDDHQYTSWGDGGGFGGGNWWWRESIGVARIEGGPSDYETHNVLGGRGAPHEPEFDGKSYGILSLDGILYLWVSPGSDTDNYREARLYRSTDGGASWEANDWAFPQASEVILPTFLQFGRDYVGSRDDYVYIYAPRLMSSDKLSVQKPGMIDLLRVPANALWDRDAYRFFAGVGEDGPRWINSIDERVPVFRDPAGVGWTVSATYNAGLERYLLMTEHQRSFSGNLGLFAAPEPWGPWRTVEYVNNWQDTRSTFFWNFSNKWTSPDGRDFTLVFTGVDDYDSWNTIRGRFRVRGTGTTRRPASRHQARLR